MVSGLEFIHNKNILHRDIKPENIVLDEDGYLRVTDFGIARVWRPENAQDTSGTPGYMGKFQLISQRLKSCAARTTGFQSITLQSA